MWSFPGTGNSQGKASKTWGASPGQGGAESSALELMGWGAEGEIRALQRGGGCPASHC